MTKKNSSKSKVAKMEEDVLFPELVDIVGDDDMLDELSFISAMNYIVMKSHGSELSKEFWQTCKRPVEYLTHELEMTKMQVLILSILAETGDAMSWRSIAKFLKTTRLSLMAYSDEIEALIDMRWVNRQQIRELGVQTEALCLESGVLKALRDNRLFVPEKIDELSTEDFMCKMERRFNKDIETRGRQFEESERWMIKVCQANPELPICKVVNEFDNIHIRSLLLLIAIDYAQWSGSDNEGLSLSLIEDFYPSCLEADDIQESLKEGMNPLMVAGYIEQKCEDGTANPFCYTLTRFAKENLLAGYMPSCSRSRRSQDTKDAKKDLKLCTTIKEKHMFYNASEQKQVERLTQLLSKDNFEQIQQRLEEEGMRKGFACLFWGSPGTGKTETVLQLARQTGRDIYQIDIANMRDKYVGESEKNIKSVFSRYRELCKNAEVMPILFFNEADGIFGKRTQVGDHNASVDKMDNAMQNIILEEMENLDGILIATTNLTCNLDSAFERRFLFKIEFHNPGTEVKTMLWKSMLKVVEEDARRLSSKFELSGGQIENISRMSTIEYVLTGKRPTIDQIENFCKQEHLDNCKKTLRRPIGFAS